MKIYPVQDLTGDSYLNPVGVPYGDGTGTHQRQVGKITSIAIHHDASPRPHDYDSIARYRSEAAEHYNRLGPGLQYHYKIDNVGTIFKIRPHETWLYAVGTAENVTAIMICLDGYFHPPYNEQPTREQYEALAQLLTDLCENHPEFPATWPNVRPHRDYSSTACCGDNLAPFITAINSKADAYNIPASAVYDWPDLQPAAPTQPPAPSVPEWEKNFSPLVATKWVEGTATVIDLSNNSTIGTVADNTQLDIAGETSVNGTKYVITKYWVSRKVYNKVIPAAQVKDTPDVVTPPPVPVTPPTPSEQSDHGLIVENNTLLKKLLDLVQKILDKIMGVFK